MRADIEAAVGRLKGGQQAVFKVPGRMKKALKALDGGAAGASQVRAVAVVWDPPAGVRERLAMGTAGGLHQGWKDVTHNFLGALTDTELVEIRAGSGMLSGAPKVQRVPLDAIRDIVTDSPRLARSLGAKIPLLVVDGGASGQLLWKFATDDQRETFVAQLREVRPG